MRRVYGYRRKNQANGRRYQDGMGVQAKGDAPVVINKETLTAVTDDDEEVEIKPAVGVVQSAPEKPIARESTENSVNPSVDQPEKPENDETGELPKHFTNFMPMDNIRPTEAEKQAQAKEDAADDTEQ